MNKELLAKIRELERKTGKSWLETLRNVKCEEELKESAKTYGIDLTSDEAVAGLRLLRAETQVLSDSELSGIAGGVKAVR
jgi:hypothetical protein